MRTTCGGLIFSSDFDSGNLAKVSLGFPPFDHAPSDLQFENHSSSLERTKSSGERCHVSTEEQIKSRRSHPGSSHHITASSNSSNIEVCTRDEVEALEKADLNFLLWTSPDGAGTRFENNYKSWFHFSVSGAHGQRVRFSMMNLNKQLTLYSHGMKPVYRVSPDVKAWERISSPVYFWTLKNSESIFIMTFCHTLPLLPSDVTYFCFSYPFSYKDCLEWLDNIDEKVGSSLTADIWESNREDIYYARELLCYSLDRLRVELITISDHHGVLPEREPLLPRLFPESECQNRCHLFAGKKVVFLSGRVHPGESPSSFMLKGFIDFLLSTRDVRATMLRKHFIFKAVPMLNPDGVKRGHYRSDSRGANLNRMYRDADPLYHPSVHAARSLFLYYHAKYSVLLPRRLYPRSLYQLLIETLRAFESVRLSPMIINKSSPHHSDKKVFKLSTATHPQASKFSSKVNKFRHRSKLAEAILQPFIFNKSHANIKKKPAPFKEIDKILSLIEKNKQGMENVALGEWLDTSGSSTSLVPKDSWQFATDYLMELPPLRPEQSGLAFYIDFHSHASKRGCFMYGNYFQEPAVKVDSMILPKLASLNSPHFDFHSCCFTLENSLKGETNKEGSGRCTVTALTGIVTSYTVECNYHSGKGINTLAQVEGGQVTPPWPNKNCPLYTPETFEQMGRAIAVSILDFAGANPLSRLTFTRHKTLRGLSDFLHRNIYSNKIKKMDRTPTKMKTKAAGNKGKKIPSKEYFPESKDAKSPEEKLSKDKCPLTRKMGVVHLNVDNSSPSLGTTPVERPPLNRPKRHPLGTRSVSVESPKNLPRSSALPRNKSRVFSRLTSFMSVDSIKTTPLQQNAKAGPSPKLTRALWTSPVPSLQPLVKRSTRAAKTTALKGSPSATAAAYAKRRQNPKAASSSLSSMLLAVMSEATNVAKGKKKNKVSINAVPSPNSFYPSKKMSFEENSISSLSSSSSSVSMVTEVDKFKTQAKEIGPNAFLSS